MFYAGMAGTRNVPIRSSLEGMREYTSSERTIDNQESLASDQQKEQGSQDDSYYVTGDMKYLVDAETVSNVQDVMDNLHVRELEISKSDMDETKKKISLQQVQNMQERCNLKIKKLRMEISLERKIAKAEKKGEMEKASELKDEYIREKNLRRTEEYSELQKTLTAQENTSDRKAYMLYDINQNGTDLLREMNQAGNYIDLRSAE